MSALGSCIRLWFSKYTLVYSFRLTHACSFSQDMNLFCCLLASSFRLDKPCFLPYSLAHSDWVTLIYLACSFDHSGWVLFVFVSWSITNPARIWTYFVACLLAHSGWINLFFLACSLAHSARTCIYFSAYSLAHSGWVTVVYLARSLAHSSLVSYVFGQFLIQPGHEPILLLGRYPIQAG